MAERAIPGKWFVEPSIGRFRVHVGMLSALMSLVWLAVIPWDLSEIDADGRLRPEGGDDVFGSWRSAMLAVGWFVSAAGVTAMGLRRRWTLATVVVVGSFWFLWRTGSARVNGANLFLAGWVLAFLPAVLLGGAMAAVLGERLRSHRHVAPRVGNHG